MTEHCTEYCTAAFCGAGRGAIVIGPDGQPGRSAAVDAGRIQGKAAMTESAVTGNAPWPDRRSATRAARSEAPDRRRWLQLGLAASWL